MKSTNYQTNKIGQVIAAWETSAADKSFAGMTLDEFKKAVQPALNVHESVTGARSGWVEARKTEDDAIVAAYKLALRVVSGVKSDPALGDDSPLYSAMGYVRASDRKNPKRKPEATTTASTPTPSA